MTIFLRLGRLFNFRLVLVDRAFEIDARVPFELVIEVLDRTVLHARFHISYAIVKTLAKEL